MKEDEPASLRKRLLSTSALNLLDQILRVVSTLVVSPVVIHGLGTDGYGAWVLALSICGCAELLDYGLSTASLRSCSRAVAAGDSHEMAVLWHFLRFRYLCLGALTAVFGAALFGLDRVLHGGFRPPSVMLLVSCLLISCGVGLASRPHATLLKSRLQYGKLIGLGILRLTVFSVALLALGPLRLSLMGIVLLHCGLQILECLGLRLLARPLRPLEDDAMRCGGGATRELRKRAAGHGLTAVAQVLRQRANTQILGAFSDMASISYYSIGSRLPGLFLDLVHALFGEHLMAGFSHLAARGEHTRLREHLMRMLRISTAVTFLGAVPLFVFGPLFLECWLGPGFESAHSVLRALTVATAAFCWNLPGSALVGALSGYGQVARLSLISALGNMALSLILVHRIGLMGVIWGSFGEAVLWGFLLWPLMAAKEADVPLWSYLGVLLGGAARIAGPAMLLALALQWQIAPASLSGLMLCIALYGVPAGLLFWLGALTGSERASGLGTLRSRLRL